MTATEQARADRKAIDLAEYVARIVAVAPPLSLAQRDRIALLLKGADAA